MLEVVASLFLLMLAVALAVVAAASRPKAEQSAPPSVPSWAVGDKSTAGATNKETMKRLNDSGKRIDFILYGDSITAWSNASFDKAFGQWVSAPMGIAGDTVEQLARRIMSGDERPAKPPKCIALLIGTNNIPKGTFPVASQRLEELIKWLQRAYPTTKLVLMALLPRNRYDTQGPNQTLRQIAARRAIMFAECGTAMHPKDTRFFRDGLHPVAKGYEVVFACLKKIVEPIVLAQ